MPKDVKIIIVGAGLSGLALAQCLRAHSLSNPECSLTYELYERDEGITSRAQGWTLSLLECLPGFSGNFPPDMPPLDASVSATRPACFNSEGRIFNEEGKPVMTAGGVAQGEPGYFLRADRQALREWLGHKLNIQWNKVFESYTETASGVHVRFTDGTTASGDVLVAADGASSRVRAQLLGVEDSKQTMPPIALIIGDVKLNKEQTERQLALSKAWWLYNASPPKPKLFVGVRSLQVAADSAIEGGLFFWFLMWPDTDVPQQGKKHWLQGASREEQISKARDLAKELPELLREVVDASKASGVVLPAVQFKEFTPPEKIPRGRVTLLGDAAHAMTPFRGQGANTAFLGVWDLTDALFKVETGDIETLEDALKHYEVEMLPRGRKNMVAAQSAFTKDAKSYAKDMAERYGRDSQDK